jgi:Rod binding domain-containing protein
MNVTTVAASSTAPTARNSQSKIKDAAEQFEALMMGELLKTAREAGSDGGWMGTGDDQAGQASVDMAEQQVAAVMSKAGGLGMRNFIMQGLQRR